VHRGRRLREAARGLHHVHARRALGAALPRIREHRHPGVGRNLHTWTNYTGYDPETNLGGAISAGLGAGGVDYFNNPQTRSFAFSITLNH